MRRHNIYLTIKIVLRVVVEVALVAAGAATRLRRVVGRVREAEVCAEAARLLQRLGEHLVLSNVVVGD